MVNALITTRIAPRDLNFCEPGRQRVLRLDEGLESPYAENILREMDEDGKLGLKTREENDPLLQRAREKTRGYPRALEALFAILASDRYTTLAELLAMPTPENVVEALVGEAFNRLDVNAQKVMQALAVYNRPVTPAAVDYLLAPHLPAIDSVPILQRLANMHFARKESGRFYLHPVDREFAYNLIPEGEKTLEELEESDFDFDGEVDVEEYIEPKEDVENTKEEHEDDGDETEDTYFDEVDFESLLRNLKQSRTDFTRYGLLACAADFFAQARKPRTDWKKLGDLAAQLAEFDLRCVAGDYNTAADVLTDISYDYLLLWGHYHLTIDLQLRMKDKITDKFLRMSNLNYLGAANYRLGELEDALSYWEQGVYSAQDANERQAESAFLSNLGNVHHSIGNQQKAIEYFERALIISRENRDEYGTGAALGNLGNVYFKIGDFHKAIEYYKQAIQIGQNINDITFKVFLSNVGAAYTNLGDYQNASEFLQQAVSISQEIGDRLNEAISIENTGHVSLSLENYLQAKKYYKQAIQISDEISYPEVQLKSRCGIAQVYLFQNDLFDAHATIKSAIQYNVPENNHNASALHGIIALRQGERETAQDAFMKSIAQADEILTKTPDYYSALDAKGLALCGLALTQDLTGLRQNLPRLGDSP